MNCNIQFLKVTDINYVLVSFSWPVWLLYNTETSMANIYRISNLLTKAMSFSLKVIAALY